MAICHIKIRIVVLIVSLIVIIKKSTCIENFTGEVLLPEHFNKTVKPTTSPV